MRKITFDECPRPQFHRDSFEILDGNWGFKFDSDNHGEKQKYFLGFETEFNILVPYTYQCEKSGINIQKRCDYVWYQKNLRIKKEEAEIILHLEGADYVTKLFVNGCYVGSQTGAYHRLSFNITNYVSDGDNLIVIKCEDDYSCEKPRGKQRWKDENFGCWYVDTTGIYKSVWLEYVNKKHLDKVKMTPNLCQKQIRFELTYHNAINCLSKINVYFKGKQLVSQQTILSDNYLDLEIKLDENVFPWDLENPNLYDVEFLLLEGAQIIDCVKSYFGLREIKAFDGKIYLNGKELYQKLVLDQGYWAKTHLTSPSNEALYDDIIKMKMLGFNGCRKHQKIEDERFLYYADVLGYIVWCEMPSMYDNTPTSREIFKKEWMAAVKDNYNHPSILVWTLFNESWGINDILTDKTQQAFVNDVYYLTKEYDPMRLVITNDGWEHTISDIITIHHYEQDGDKLYHYLESLDKVLNGTWEAHHKGAMADGYVYRGQPIMITEFGGTAYQKTTGNGNWGYGSGVKDDEEYIERLTKLFRGLNRLEYSVGYCYTQVSDVQQEVNGLLFENHQFKVNPKVLKQIQDERD